MSSEEARLIEAERRLDRAWREVGFAAKAAHEGGMTWAEIGAALHMSRQAAQKRARRAAQAARS